MRLEVRLFAYFREGRGKKIFIDDDNISTIKEVLEFINLGEEEISLLLLNGFDGTVHRQLKDGDVLSLFPPVGGG
ncbi:MoaD/ThiS family protein [Clostridium grantii]|uniref:Molybdopterin converting factor, small subunit n=1 Tax=Clostridium grantii DSM 8605 TaxID=1121316 RepID=A0A1M5RPZ5_9CLOT|nr:MoaD/ThiS family protein [Clostridium grantii]SHH28178.1 Molybdopterin converting factor, small subunit [Clostridium grantii DSM 8605]